MIEEQAVILSLETPANQPDITLATLEIERKTACGLCGQTRGCGNSIWGKLFAHQSSAFKAHNRIQAQIGDSVIVGIEEKSLLISALLLYIVPLVTMMIAAILALQWSGTDLGAMLGAVFGLVIGLLWVKGYTASSRYLMLQQPEILRLANSALDLKVVKL